MIGDWNAFLNSAVSEDESQHLCRHSRTRRPLRYKTFVERRLSKPEQEYFLRRKQFVQRDWLRTPEQLPELEASKITLFWDFTGTEEAGETATAFRFGQQVVWAEPAVWEGYERFAEVLSILRQKYGELLVDLVPTPKGELYLYGDRLSSPAVVDRARAAIRDKNP